jgi:3-carboxy-cis,cis-muconate cycloisomerase
MATRGIDAFAAPAGPLSLLTWLYGDPVALEILSLNRVVERWLRIECALADAQAEVGVISLADAAGVRSAARIEHIDLDRLREEARHVGDPILPLVEMVVAALPGVEDRVHYGATTQDIMDTELVLALRELLGRMLELLSGAGDRIAELVAEHATTPMAARTHAQHAVPTTLGAKLATFLSQWARHRHRLERCRAQLSVVSLYGAGGTSAALGPHAARVRESMASQLGLRNTDVPWHVTRDGLIEFGQLCANLCGSLARLAREVVDLSRTEVAELCEAFGHRRGASSSMPQKRNPVTSEAIIGISISVAALAGGLPRVAEAGHERSAGEWRAEWFLLPNIAALTAAGLAAVTDLVAGLEMDPVQMARNLLADNGLVMAEAWMMRLAPSLGRQQAHDLVYEAGRRARANGTSLADELPAGSREVAGSSVDGAAGYLGLAQAVCAAAVDEWRGAARNP